MKTRVSQIVAIAFFALFILVGNVNAKGIEKSASSHENIEEALELENWMVNDYFWITSNILELETEMDESLELESWMTNENIWESNITIETETEQTLALEAWMTNENNWNR